MQSIEFDKGALHLFKTGTSLGFSCICIAKALQLYHKFQPTAAKHKINCLSVSAAILDICVFEETGQDEYKSIVCAFHQLNSNGSDIEMVTEEDIAAMKADLTKLQMFILQTLKFDIAIGEAYTIAVRCLLILRDRPEFESIRHTIVKFTCKCITQFYLNNRCLKFSAEEIAVGCIDLAFRVFFVDLPNWKEKLSVTAEVANGHIFNDLMFVLDVMH